MLQPQIQQANELLQRREGHLQLLLKTCKRGGMMSRQELLYYWLFLMSVNYDSAKGSETLEQTFNRLHVIVSQPEFMDIEIEQDDLNQKFLISLAPEWLMHTIVWRNISDLDTMSLDDLYNLLKVYKSEVQKKSESDFQNMAFISSSKNSSGNEEVNAASIPTASTQVSHAGLNINEDDIEEMDIKWNMALLSMRADRFWKKTGKKISIQGTDVAGFDKSKVECFNCHKIGHFAREGRAPRSQDRGRTDNYRQGSKVEEQAPKALMAINEVEARLVEFKNQEVKFYEKIRGLELTVEFKTDTIKSLTNKLDLLKKEKEGLDSKLTGFQSASKDLDNLLERLLEFVDDTIIDYSRSLPAIESNSDEFQNKKPSVAETGASSDSIILSKPAIKFVKAVDRPTKNKTDKVKTVKKPVVQYAELYRKTSKKSNIMNLLMEDMCHLVKDDTRLLEKEQSKSLLDDANVLLRTHRQHNMYSIDLNNVVLHKDLTCLVAKASADECMLWHRRLGHLNIKTMNRVHDALLESPLSNAQDTCKADAPESKPSSDTRLISKRVANQVETPSLDNILTLTNRFEDILRVTTNSVELDGVEADVSNMETTITACPTPTLRIQKDHPKKPKKISDALQDPSWVEAMQEELLQFKIQHVWSLVDCPKGVRPIRTKWVLKNKKDKRGIVIRNKARLLAQGYTQEEGNDYDEIDVKSAFLYGTIDEEVGTINQTLFIRKQRGYFILVQVYVDDIIFGSSNPQLCRELKALMHEKFQMSAMDVRSANTLMDKENPWGKDRTGKDVDLHLYRAMIRSLMYLTASKADIMFAVFKRIFRYLKGHPKLGLWYPKESLFDLVAYSDSDYSCATQDRKSTTRGCQFLGRRLISWQCKKQTIVATSTTEAEYVEAATGCGQVL
nr:hypothetical protein [Tanacetum cinerariifolium]